MGLTASINITAPPWPDCDSLQTINAPASVSMQPHRPDRRSNPRPRPSACKTPLLAFQPVATTLPYRNQNHQTPLLTVMDSSVTLPLRGAATRSSPRDWEMEGGMRPKKSGTWLQREEICLSCCTSILSRGVNIHGHCLDFQKNNHQHQQLLCKCSSMPYVNMPLDDPQQLRVLAAVQFAPSMVLSFTQHRHKRGTKCCQGLGTPPPTPTLEVGDHHNAGRAEAGSLAHGRVGGLVEGGVLALLSNLLEGVVVGTL